MSTASSDNVVTAVDNLKFRNSDDYSRVYIAPDRS